MHAVFVFGLGDWSNEVDLETCLSQGVALLVEDPRIVVGVDGGQVMRSLRIILSAVSAFSPAAATSNVAKERPFC